MRGKTRWRWRWRVFAKHSDGAAGRQEKPEQHRDRGRLAGTVGTEQRAGGAALDVKR